MFKRFSRKQTCRYFSIYWYAQVIQDITQGRVLCGILEAVQKLLKSPQNFLYWGTPLMPGNDTSPSQRRVTAWEYAPLPGAQTNINFGTTQLWDIYVSFFFSFKDKKTLRLCRIIILRFKVFELCLRVKSKKKRVLFAVLLLYHALKKSLPKSF